MKETKTQASDFSILTATVVDVGESWIHSRRVHAAGRLQASVVVLNKAQARTSQAVHRRLVQEDVVAVPGDIGSSSAVLVHRGHVTAVAAVMRQIALWFRWIQADVACPFYRTRFDRQTVILEMIINYCLVIYNAKHDVRRDCSKNARRQRLE